MSTKIAAALLFGWGIGLLGSALLPQAATAQESAPDPLDAGTAAEPPAAPPVTAVAPADPGFAKPSVVPRVVAAASNDDDDPNRIALGYVVAVHVQNLARFLESTGTKCDKLTLFIHDVPIVGSQPDSCDLDDEHVRFTLLRDEESAAAWRLLFTEPWEFTNTVSLSVGPHERLSWPSAVEELELVILPRFWVYVYFVGLVLAVVLFVWLARGTSLLRDRSENVAEGTLAPYSLARFQLAFWGLLVVAAYVFIWMITGELDTITGSVLALLGIGSGTALGAALIDQGKDEASAASAAAAASAAPAASATVSGAAGEATVTASLPAAAAKPAPPAKMTTRGFLKDVLSDERGISLHRFQLFVWTLVLGVIFCKVVYFTLQMPQFSATMLGLMGISSGTYLGLKMPEKTARE